MTNQTAVSVLFVCMGNICRSPMAEGAFRRVLRETGLAGRVHVDSAGTHSYHEGSPPDDRGQETAARRGVDLSALRARQVERADFEHFDYLLVMDRANYRDLLRLCPRAEQRAKIRLLLDFAPALDEREVPDPYYGGPAGFEQVMDLVETAAEGLLRELRERHSL